MSAKQVKKDQSINGSNAMEPEGNTMVEGKEENIQTDEDENVWKVLTFATGIFMLTFALFMSARMGIYQEVMYAKYGKHPKEALYYSHCLPLAGFVLLYSGMSYIKTI